MSWRTIPEMVLSTADRFGDAEALIDGPVRLSYVELAERIRRAAGAFHALGVAKGDRVAVWAPNSADWVIAALGAVTAGGVVVPVNTRFKGAEAADILSRSCARALVTTTDFLGTDYVAMLRVREINPARAATDDPSRKSWSETDSN